MVAYQALRDGVLLFDEAALVKLAEHPDLSLLNGQELRSVAVAKYTPEVAKFAGVRRALLQFQRDFAHQPGGAILDGRDIGTVVCPDADVKLFVSASLEARAERRSKELRANGERVNISRIKRDLADRDERDMNRADSPLRPSPDAHQLDTTDLSIEASVEAACRIVNAATARPPA
ncbi:cytidylate kinase [alpha proteobacterium U9-1i]|nr:cytidylate kinase [alpha proteobacterium U9-1i]